MRVVAQIVLVVVEYSISQLPVPDMYCVTLADPLEKGPPAMEEKKRAGPTQKVASGMYDVTIWLTDVTSTGAASEDG